jgi:hypothetical protein
MHNNTALQTGEAANVVRPKLTPPQISSRLEPRLTIQKNQSMFSRYVCSLVRTYAIDEKDVVEKTHSQGGGRVKSEIEQSFKVWQPKIDHGACHLAMSREETFGLERIRLSDTGIPISTIILRLLLARR